VQAQPAARAGLGLPRTRLSGAERANVVTHAAGAVLALAGTAMLVPLAVAAGSTAALAAVLGFGGAAGLVYLASSLQHALVSGRVHTIFLALDHCGIFLLIAATYTPFALLALNSTGLLGAVWAAALCGMALQIAAFASGRVAEFERVAYWLYLALGWLPLIWVAGPVWRTLPAAGLGLLLAGGVAYSLGVVFYRAQRLRYGHAIWHVFSVAGTGLHFGAVACLL